MFTNVLTVLSPIWLGSSSINLYQTIHATQLSARDVNNWMCIRIRVHFNDLERKINGQTRFLNGLKWNDRIYSYLKVKKILNDIIKVSSEIVYPPRNSSLTNPRNCEKKVFKISRD